MNRNIWYQTGEHSSLSNLSLRYFKDLNGLHYVSVEHAYQSWKSGKFDEDIYNKDWRSGKKFRGKSVNKNISYNLMNKIIRASINQNKSVKLYLLSTWPDTLTHTNEKGYWRDAFPKILMDFRLELIKDNIGGGNTSS